MAITRTARFDGGARTHLSDKAEAQAPLPGALKSAKTAFLINEAGDQQRFDDLATELTAWKRLTLVDSQDSADITITFGAGATGTGLAVPIGGMLVTDDQRAFTLTIRDRTSGNPIWNDREAIGISSKGTVKKLVKRLRERLEREKKK